jgi:hypothetical protein
LLLLQVLLLHMMQHPLPDPYGVLPWAHPTAGVAATNPTAGVAGTQHPPLLARQLGRRWADPRSPLFCT